VTDIITESTYHELDPGLVREARKAGLEMRNSKRTRWFTVGDVGFAGVMLFRSKARLVSAYVRPDMRRCGIRTRMIETRLAAAKEHGCSAANLITMRPDWYLARGWTTCRAAKKHGWYWVERTL
jgi:GNAT superfamily N-acetyltransferase